MTASTDLPLDNQLGSTTGVADFCLIMKVCLVMAGRLLGEILVQSQRSTSTWPRLYKSGLHQSSPVSSKRGSVSAIWLDRAQMFDIAAGTTTATQASSRSVFDRRSDCHEARHIATLAEHPTAGAHASTGSGADPSEPAYARRTNDGAESRKQPGHNSRRQLP